MFSGESRSGCSIEMLPVHDAGEGKGILDSRCDI